MEKHTPCGGSKCVFHISIISPYNSFVLLRLSATFLNFFQFLGTFLHSTYVYVPETLLNLLLLFSYVLSFSFYWLAAILLLLIFYSRTIRVLMALFWWLSLSFFLIRSTGQLLFLFLFFLLLFVLFVSMFVKIYFELFSILYVHCTSSPYLPHYVL